MITFDGVCHWANLVEWCRNDYERGLIFTYSFAQNCAWVNGQVVAAALLLAQPPPTSWVMVERGLQALRLVAGALDVQRLEDREVGK